jgi:hypothetical protein
MEFNMRRLSFSAVFWVAALMAFPAWAEVDCQSKAFAEFVEDASFTCKEMQTATVTGFAGDLVLRRRSLPPCKRR